MIPPLHANKAARSRLETVYREQLSAVIQLERLMVELGYLAPEQRRVISRGEERAAGTIRQIDNNGKSVVR